MKLRWVAPHPLLAPLCEAGIIGKRQRPAIHPSLDVFSQFGGRLITPGGVLLQGPVDNVDQRPGNGRIQLAWVRRVLRPDPIQNLVQILSRKRQYPGEHLEQNDAETPDVGAAIDRSAARLLGAHVTDGAEDHAGDRSRRGHRRRVGAVG